MAYCMPCNRRATRREGVGPSGRKEWMILVDSCYRCGRHYPIKPNELTLEQKSWVKRWNNKMDSAEPEPVPEPSTDTSHHGRWVIDTSAQGGHYE